MSISGSGEGATPSTLETKHRPTLLVERCYAAELECSRTISSDTITPFYRNHFSALIVVPSPTAEQISNSSINRLDPETPNPIPWEVV